MQRVLQKHYKWLFSIMLVIIIIAFVFTIGGSPGIGHSRASTKKQMYYGVNLGNPQEIQTLFRNANLSNILNTGQNISNNQMAENLALARPLLLTIANKLELIRPNEYELTEYIKTMPIFKDRDGNFDQNKYKEFIQTIKSDPKINEHIVREVLTEDFRMDHVIKLLSGPGYVLPYETQLILERQKTVWSVDIATLDFKDFNSNISVPEDKLEEYYKTNKFNFATPTRIEIAYTSFPIEQFQAKVPNPSDQELNDFYETHLSLFPQPKDNTKPFEEIKNSVIESYKKDRATRLAAEAAHDLQLELYNNAILFNSDKFKSLLKKYHLSLTDVPAFDENTIPTGTPLPQPLLRQALTLNAEHYFSDVASSSKGAFIVFFKKEHPVYIPPIEEIKNELKQQYLAKENLRLLDSRAKILDKTLTADIKSGKAFKNAAKDENLKLVSFDNFNILEAPKGLDKTLLPDIQALSKGEISPIIMRDDRVYFIYIKDKETPLVTADSADAQTLLKQLEPFNAAMRSQNILNELISQALKESEKS